MTDFVILSHALIGGISAAIGFGLGRKSKVQKQIAGDNAIQIQTNSLRSAEEARQRVKEVKERKQAEARKEFFEEIFDNIDNWIDSGYNHCYPREKLNTDIIIGNITRQEILDYFEGYGYKIVWDELISKEVSTINKISWEDE